MNHLKPPSLLNLATKSLLRDKVLATDALKDLPTVLFPHLFLEAYHHKCVEILRAMVPAWPFPCLPLGSLMANTLPLTTCVNAVLEGIDAFLAQKVHPRRSKLQVLDLRNSDQDFWMRWTGVKFSANLPSMEPVINECTRTKQVFPCIDVFANLCVHDSYPDSFASELMEWASKRKGVHLCFVKVSLLSMLWKSDGLSYAEILCIKELALYNTWTLPALKLFAPLMGEMKRLKRLTLNITLPATVNQEEIEERRQTFSQWAYQFQQLSHLRGLYLQSPSFLQDHLDKWLSCFITSLESFSMTDCSLPDSDLTHLFQCPHLTQLKYLCLKGTPLTRFREPLRDLLEKCASVLQHLDLASCGLQDSHLEVLLPALSSCSNLSSLRLHGNELSMVSLKKLLHCTSRLSRLSLEIYPAPLECVSSQGGLHSERFDVLCVQLFQVLRDLGHPRTILLSPKPCPYITQMLENWLIIATCYNCVSHSRKLSFGISGSEI